ncbi:threonine/serine exporter family protein [Prevotella ihumii]|uniref:threonine/serine exporter family protein n=1 Tax=Prevotella ihumii TaxID=1917878 RepID=UPI000981374C|nr:threonine/serine exporter family protein [Prevotella ihumii]
MTYLLLVLEDAFYAALAGIGFASISNPPKNAYKYCAFISAVGHAVRYVFMHNNYHEFGLIFSSFVAALAIGFVSVGMASKAKCPPETFSFPSLLPMIPGMYAYRTVEGLVMCLFTEDEQLFNHYLYLCTSNGLTCAFDILGMVLGTIVPIFILNKISFRVTRS